MEPKYSILARRYTLVGDWYGMCPSFRPESPRVVFTAYTVFSELWNSFACLSLNFRQGHTTNLFLTLSVPQRNLAGWQNSRCSDELAGNPPPPPPPYWRVDLRPFATPIDVRCIKLSLFCLLDGKATNFIFLAGKFLVCLAGKKEQIIFFPVILKNTWKCLNNIYFHYLGYNNTFFNKLVVGCHCYIL